jgi:gamma-glutamyltranspeptidase/glutathione hydrolase
MHLNEYPYPSRRRVVLAANGAVATAQPLAAAAGLAVLRAGGNAVDAAIATAIALTVVEPVMNGIGSDAFALIWDGAVLHGLNGSGRAPHSWSPVRFAGRSAMPTEGWESVTVPGAVSAWAAISGRFGKLPFADLFGPAITYARDGFLVSPVIARQWEEQVARLGAEPGFAEAFLRGGRAPRAGERFRFPEQGDTLEEIARTGGESLYRGRLAERITAFANGAGLSFDDLASHRPDWVAPASHGYRGHLVHEIPPNGQGLAALIALGILEHVDLAADEPDSADSLHLQIEAMKLAFVDTYRYVSDPSTMEWPWPRLLDHDYLRARAGRIDRRRAGSPVPGVPPSGTVHLAAADAGGMMVSYIQSNYLGFGSGLVVPGTGISLHNRGAGFSLQPGHPNVVGAGKRPFHTIIPAFLTREGRPIMSFGVMGADMQPQGHVQMTVRVIDYGQNPQAAADAPRWRLISGRGIAVEETMPKTIRAGLAEFGHELTVEPLDSVFAFGGAQLILKGADGSYVAGSDPRKDGQAVAF